MSAGFEDQMLLKNVQDQLGRLVQQIKDLEECRDDLTEEEYIETKEDTKEQLREFEISLEKMTSGDLSVMDSLTSVRTAIRAAISEAFRTPEVIKLFAGKQTGGLRQRLTELDRDSKIGKISSGAFVEQKLEILAALKRLNDELSSDEKDFFERHSTTSMRQFVQLDEGSESIQDGTKILSMAKKF